MKSQMTFNCQGYIISDVEERKTLCTTIFHFILLSDPTPFPHFYTDDYSQATRKAFCESDPTVVSYKTNFAGIVRPSQGVLRAREDRLLATGIEQGEGEGVGGARGKDIQRRDYIPGFRIREHTGDGIFRVSLPRILLLRRFYIHRGMCRPSKTTSR